ncbi:carbohydrate esterase family 5 protein [Hypoxylon trugodes]|uniref:carbohydrate esterase family 5 protein n=1 Tax=Hypoxylon trugodes TaxID=326681 RepID=UPI002195992D|nr:carbohydrate esterase family 5 protein [Hypoxylon trugodes]KAI1385705.1 carbohydrate esterase family 5 protein [Hypoxylon trugodes]
MFALSDLNRAAFLSAAIHLLAFSTAQETGLNTCTDVHIFLSRGNNEQYPGRQGKLVQAICSGLNSCDYEDVVFDDALETNYCVAVEAGREAGIAQITAYNKKCPNTKLVVSGYSQGAHVLGDILGGGGGVFFQGCTTPTAGGLDPKTAPGNKIAAALLFGDVRHTAHQPYNTLGGAGINGIFPRPLPLLTGVRNFASVLRDWCQVDDPICAQGNGKRAYNVQDHLNYFDRYSGAAAEWVKSKLGEAGTSTSSSATATWTESSSSAGATATSSADTSSTPTTLTGSTMLPEPTASPSPSQGGGAGVVEYLWVSVYLAALVSLVSMMV